jgi:hypothetical protein
MHTVLSKVEGDQVMDGDQKVSYCRVMEFSLAIKNPPKRVYG